MPSQPKDIELVGGPLDGHRFRCKYPISTFGQTRSPGGPGEYQYEEEFPKRMTHDGYNQPTGCWAFRFVGLRGCPAKPQRRRK